MAKSGVEPGSLVRLKSGGPVMVVTRCKKRRSGAGPDVECLWFDVHGELQRAALPFVCLEEVEAEAPEPEPA